MTSQEFLENIQETYRQCFEILEKKNKDYAGESDPFRNFKSSELVGVEIDRAILVRIMDKISRISNLLTAEPRITEEKLEDTLNDAINYLAILKAYRESIKQDEQIPF